MDTAPKTGLVAIATALITAVATVFASYLNLLKPSEKQVSESDRYRVVIEENAALKIRNAELASQVQSTVTSGATITRATTEQVASLSSANSSLRGENTALKERLARAEADTERLREQVAGSTARKPDSTNAQLPSAAIAGVTSSGPVRTSHMLRLNEVVRMHDDSTISMHSLKRHYAGLGAAFYVNGSSTPVRYIGERISTRRDRTVECYFEVMALDADEKLVGTERAKLDYVCNSLRTGS